MSQRLLTLVPYTILPPRSGGQMCITMTHHYLSRLCQDHVVGTRGNGPDESYNFSLHKFFPESKMRYLPLYGLEGLKGIGKMHDVTAIFCEQPYMAATAHRLSLLLKVPWYLRTLNLEYQRFRDLGKPWWRILKWYEGNAMKRADGVFFIAPEEQEIAIKEFGLSRDKCHFIPYGTVLQKPPEPVSEEKRNAFANANGLDPSLPWIYFLGAMDYYPNAQAVYIILKEIIPRLKEKGFRFQLIIAGKSLSEDLQRYIAEYDDVCKYLGFVDDLSVLITSCHTMINPIITGGGIKTKLVEALGYNKMAVSTRTAAQGLLPELCGHNLVLTKDDNWDEFVVKLITSIEREPMIPERFYQTYNWEAIAGNILEILDKNQ